LKKKKRKKRVIEYKNERKNQRKNRKKEEELLNEILDCEFLNSIEANSDLVYGSSTPSYS